MIKTSSGERWVATKEECTPILHHCGKKTCPKTTKSELLFGGLRRMNCNSSHHAESVHPDRSRTAIKAVSLNSSSQQFLSTTKIYKKQRLRNGHLIFIKIG